MAELGPKMNRRCTRMEALFEWLQRTLGILRDKIVGDSFGCPSLSFSLVEVMPIAKVSIRETMALLGGNP